MERCRKHSLNSALEKSELLITQACFQLKEMSNAWSQDCWSECPNNLVIVCSFIRRQPFSEFPQILRSVQALMLGFLSVTRTCHYESKLMFFASSFIRTHPYAYPQSFLQALDLRTVDQPINLTFIVKITVLCSFAREILMQLSLKHCYEH